VDSDQIIVCEGGGLAGCGRWGLEFGSVRLASCDCLALLGCLALRVLLVWMAAWPVVAVGGLSSALSIWLCAFDWRCWLALLGCLVLRVLLVWMAAWPVVAVGGLSLASCGWLSRAVAWRCWGVWC
jgi:hypothetical protein